MSKKPKKKSIIRRTALNIALLGLIILAGVCAVTGLMFFNALLGANTELAYAYGNMVDLQLYSIDIEKMYAEGDAFAEKVQQGLSAKGYAALSEEDQKLVDEWNRVENFLYQVITFNRNLVAFQVIVPTEEDVICIWLADNNSDSPEYPMMHRSYRENEERLLQFLNSSKTGYEQPTMMGVFREGNQILGTATLPIYDVNDPELVNGFIEVDISLTDIRTAILQMMLIILAFLCVIMTVVLIIYYRIQKKKIISPILQLEKTASGVVDKLEKGEKPEKTDIHTGDEIEALAHSFENMEENLWTYIEENAEITAEKERLNTELELAANIQSDMLPSSFPAFPDRKEFDIFASMMPAKEVGGDFYDFFFVDENTLVLVIADVSGKGVPASLFMMRTMIAIENLAAHDSSPSSILTSLNRQLSVNNESSMFVTVWLGILDLKSGLMKAANAGHEYPIICRPGGCFDILKDKHSFIVGGREKTTYKEYEIQMIPGTKLFVYSDGLPEARNAEGEMFHLERTKDALNRMMDGTPKELLQSVDQSVSSFVHEAEQFDDLTMMCLSYYGTAGKDALSEETESEICVEASTDRIPDVKEFLKKGLSEAGASEKAIKHCQISAEELFGNIAMYAYDGSDLPEEEKTALVRFRVTGEPRSAIITFIDRGIPYDPLKKKDPNVKLKAKERVPGGLGIFMSKKLMDDIYYQYSEGRNILMIVKRIQ